MNNKHINKIFKIKQTIPNLPQPDQNKRTHNVDIATILQYSLKRNIVNVIDEYSTL